jgi:tetratricopeptide (TPR) repeat protein
MFKLIRTVATTLLLLFAQTAFLPVSAHQVIAAPALDFLQSEPNCPVRETAPKQSFITLTEFEQRLENELHQVLDLDYLTDVQKTSSLQEGLQKSPTVCFNVSENGELSSMKVFSSSNQLAFDLAAVDSLAKLSTQYLLLGVSPGPCFAKFDQTGHVIVSPPATAEFDAWFAHLDSAIRKRWDPPEGDPSKEAVIRFKIHKDGSISSIRVEDFGNGEPAINKLALQTVREAAPFSPLPLCLGQDFEFSLGFHAKDLPFDESQRVLQKKVSNRLDDYICFVDPDDPVASEYQNESEGSSLVSWQVAHWRQDEKDNLRFFFRRVLNRVPGLLMGASSGQPIRLMKSTIIKVETHSNVFERMEHEGGGKTHACNWNHAIVFADSFFAIDSSKQFDIVVHELVHASDIEGRVSSSPEFTSVARPIIAEMECRIKKFGADRHKCQQWLEQLQWPSIHACTNLHEALACYAESYITDAQFRQKHADERKLLDLILQPANAQSTWRQAFSKALNDEIQGTIGLRQRKYHEANELFNNALAKHWSQQCALKRALCHELIGSYAKAANDYVSAYAGWVSIGSASSFWSPRIFMDDKRRLGLCVKRRPSDPRAYIERAHCLSHWIYTSGLPRLAASLRKCSLSDLNVAIKLHAKDQSNLLMECAWLEIGLDHYSSAVSYLTRALAEEKHRLDLCVKRAPSNPQSYLDRAHRLSYWFNIPWFVKRVPVSAIASFREHALSDLNVAIKLDAKDQANLLLECAKLEIELDHYSAAVGYSTRALAMKEPIDGNMWQTKQALTLRIDAYEKLGEKDLARIDLTHLKQILHVPKNIAGLSSTTAADRLLLKMQEVIKIRFNPKDLLDGSTSDDPEPCATIALDDDTACCPARIVHARITMIDAAHCSWAYHEAV